MRTQLTVLLVLGTVMLPNAGLAEKAAKSAKETAYQKPVKILIGAIRYGKDDLALKQLALEDMSKGLLTQSFGKMGEAQQKEFVTGLGRLLRKLSFPKARELFQHIDAILYDPPKEVAKGVTLRSTVVVHRAYKKQELVLTWTLIKKGKDYQVLDVETVGESTLDGIREEEVEPLVKEGGVKLLMEKLRAKIKEVGA